MQTNELCKNWIAAGNQIPSLTIAAAQRTSVTTGEAISLA
jgi:hypothetical protein